MTNLGEKLRDARVEAGVSLTAVAVRSHYSQAATPDVVLAYARALGEDAMKRRGIVVALGAGAVAPTARCATDPRRICRSPASRAEEDWAARVADYGRDYMAVGAAELRTRLAGDLVVLQQQIATPGMWASAARLLAVYGKTTGEPREAVRWYRLAAEAADRSGDPSAAVWVRGRAAIALAYEGAALGVAETFADEALALDGKPSTGRLNALVARAHVAAGRGDVAGAVAADEEARRVFDRVAAPAGEVSDFAVPPWRMATFRSMLYARLGDVRRGETAQDEADATRPGELQRFATHIELHRGLMMTKAGDRAGGLAHARAALATLPAEKRSQPLRLVMTEVERAAT